ncbi:DUF742 domain-containing protein [Nocardia sp. CA-084685]|uniref:DUF742 domain-containing protein n=1 Tax=Nocardia sp. CA-084685 TaxID=3239970 RepID=UPI003D961ACC
MNNYDSDFRPEYEDDPGPLIRPFAVTRGRAGSGTHNLDILTLVVAIGSDTDTDAVTLEREYSAIVRMCQGRPLSIAEIAAHLNLLVAAVKVLVGDLINSGYVIVRSPVATGNRPDSRLLQAVLDGVRKL